MSVPKWSEQLYPKLGQTGKIPINQKIAVSQEKSERTSSRSQEHERLLEFDISRIKGGKTKGVYSVRELAPIAEILKVPKNLSKQELVDEILRIWKNRYPEDFTE